MLISEKSEASRKNSMNQNELARYLEVDEALILEWANSGRIPAQKESGSFIFDKSRIDEWIASGKVK